MELRSAHGAQEGGRRQGIGRGGGLGLEEQFDGETSADEGEHYPGKDRRYEDLGEGNIQMMESLMDCMERGE